MKSVLKLAGAAGVGCLVLFWIAQGVILRTALAATLETHLGVGVKIQDFQWDPWRSQVKVRGVELGSPRGFEKKTMARLDSLDVRYSLAGLFAGRVLVERCDVSIGLVAVEQNDQGRLNLLSLASTQSAAPRGQDRARGEGARKPKKSVVEIEALRVVVRRVEFLRAGSRLGGIDKGYDLGLEIEFEHVESVGDGVRAVVWAILKKVGLETLVIQNWGMGERVTGILGEGKGFFGEGVAAGSEILASSVAQSENLIQGGTTKGGGLLREALFSVRERVKEAAGGAGSASSSGSVET